LKNRNVPSFIENFHIRRAWNRKGSDRGNPYPGRYREHIEEVGGLR